MTTVAYEIANYLTHDEKFKASQARYTADASGARRSKTWSVDIGQCPLGVALDLKPPLQGATAVVLELLKRGRVTEPQDHMKAATHFIRDWDLGVITDLKGALGL